MELCIFRNTEVIGVNMKSKQYGGENYFLHNNKTLCIAFTRNYFVWTPHKIFTYSFIFSLWNFRREMITQIWSIVRTIYTMFPVNSLLASNDCAWRTLKDFIIIHKNMFHLHFFCKNCFCWLRKYYVRILLMTDCSGLSVRHCPTSGHAKPFLIIFINGIIQLLR